MMHMPLFVQRILLLLSCLAVALVAGCKKENTSGVPFAGVDITINVNNPSYSDIQVPGGWLYLTGGSLGIIVYRKTLDEFVALDRHCPYLPGDLCRVIVDESEVIARDTTCCQSAFLIMDGSVTEGPASIGLQQYQTSFNGTLLRIYN
jgi:nitrite reductase/ring-hydroxylating ferredoxin subunit